MKFYPKSRKITRQNTNFKMKMKIHQKIYCIATLLHFGCIGGNSYARRLFIEPTASIGIEKSAGAPLIKETMKQEIDDNNISDDAAESTLGIDISSPKQEDARPITEEPQDEPASSQPNATAPYDAFTGIKTWLEGTALPVLQNARDYTTDNLIPQAQEMTETVANQAQETGKTIVNYVQTTLVPGLKELANRLGTTLIAWSQQPDEKNKKAEETDTEETQVPLKPNPSQDAPII